MADAVELATAYLSLVPSFKGAQAAIESELTNMPALKKAGETSGRDWTKNLATGIVATSSVAAGAASAMTAGLVGAASKIDTAYDAIRIGTGATGAQLEDLQTAFRNVSKSTPAELDVVATAVADLNTRMGLTGPALETVARQVIEAGNMTGAAVDINAASAAFAALGVKAADVPGAMDHVFQVSQATGVSMNELTGTLSKQGAALKTLGFSFNDSAAMIGVLDKAGVNVNSVMAGMSKSLVTLTKDGERPAEAFKRVAGEIGALTKSGREAEALQLAGKVFGTKGAAQFVSALKAGKIGLDDMTKAAQLSGDGIIALADETADFPEALQKLQNEATLALAPIGLKLFPVIQRAVEAAVPPLTRFADFLAGLSDGQLLGVVAAVGGLVAIAPAVAGVTMAVKGVSAAMTGIRAAGAAVTATRTVLSTFHAGLTSSAAAASSFTGRAGTLGGAVRTAGTAIASGASAVGQWTVATAKAGATGLANGARAAAGAVRTAAAAFGRGALAAGRYSAALARTGGAAVVNGARAAAVATRSVAVASGQATAALIRQAAAAAGGAAAWVRQTAVMVATRAAQIAATAATGLMTAAQAALNFVMSINPIALVVLAIAGLVAAVVVAYNKVGWFKDGVDSAFRLVQSAIQAVAGWLTGTAMPAIGAAWDTAVRGAQIMGEAIASVWDALVGFVDAGVQNIVGFVSGGWSGMISTVAGGMNSIVGTVTGALGDVTAGFQGMVSDSIAALGGMVAQAAGIGGDIVAGIAHGVRNAAGALFGTLRDLAAGAINAAKNALGIHSPSKRFASEVGHWIPAGAGDGVEKNAAAYTDAVDVMFGYQPQVPDIAGPRSWSLYSSSRSAQVIPVRAERVRGEGVLSGADLEELVEFMAEAVSRARPQVEFVEVAKAVRQGEKRLR